MRFRDRADAGSQLASLLLERDPRLPSERPFVLALPRGGVPVAVQVALALGAPLEVVVSRKLGVPDQPEFGFGAVAEGGGIHVDADTVRLLALSEETIERVTEAQAQEVARRVERYRQGRPLPILRGRVAILVDDGIATGGTAKAAIRSVRRLRPDRLVLAVPVASASARTDFEREVDELVALKTPETLWAIGAWYEDFGQLSDAEVLAWLEAARARHEAEQPAP
ncbi:MAG TPA: phosphoribosyltransferase family protein [Vulgatibacter sp.]|nr:phosphoribosyltransferase family protein [Vulgatibacter sp.]